MWRRLGLGLGLPPSGWMRGEMVLDILCLGLKTHSWLRGKCCIDPLCIDQCTGHGSMRNLRGVAQCVFEIDVTSTAQGLREFELQE